MFGCSQWLLLQVACAVKEGSQSGCRLALPRANCCPSRRMLVAALSPHLAPCPSMCCSEYAVWDVTKQPPHKPACKKAAGKKAAGKKAAGGGSGGGRRGGRK